MEVIAQDIALQVINLQLLREVTRLAHQMATVEVPQALPVILTVGMVAPITPAALAAVAAVFKTVGHHHHTTVPQAQKVPALPVHHTHQHRHPVTQLVAVDIQ